MYQITINLLERCQDSHLPKVNLKNYFTAVTKTLIMKSMKKNQNLFLSLVQNFESFHLALKTTLDRFVRLNKKLCKTTINPSWQKPFVKLLWRDLNEKISSIRKEMTKIGSVTNNNEIIVQIFSQNPKHVILIISVLRMQLKTTVFGRQWNLFTYIKLKIAVTFSRKHEFLSLSLKKILLTQSKNYHQIKHQSQMTYPFQ